MGLSTHRCIDVNNFEEIEIEKFAGINWEENIGKIKNLT